MTVWLCDVNAGLAGRCQWYGREIPISVWWGDASIGEPGRFKKSWCGREFKKCWCGREISILVWQGDVNSCVAGEYQC